MGGGEMRETRWGGGGDVVYKDLIYDWFLSNTQGQHQFYIGELTGETWLNTSLPVPSNIAATT